MTLRRGEAQDVEHLELPGLRASAEAAHEVVRAVELIRDRVQTREVVVDGDIATEDEDLESRVRRQKVLDFVRPCVGAANESMGQDTLADDELRCEGLVRVVDDGGRGVVDPNAGCERAESQESPADTRVRTCFSRYWTRGAYSKNCSWLTPS